jgi:uncharacterized membrane protein YeaQ/YmgE (transglycosylase-associated protein family)
MNNDPQVGCFSWILLVFVCALPMHWLGAGMTVSLVSGVIGASVALAAIGAFLRRNSS